MRETLLLKSITRSYPLRTHLDSTEDASLPPEFDLDNFFDDWRDAFDSEEDFRERLGFSDHTVESAREQFETASRDSPDAIRSVFETAEQVVDRAIEYDRDAVEPLLARHDDSPFVDLLAPLVEAGRERPDLENDYATSAGESLVDWLFERVRQVFQHPLFILFKAYQRTEYPETDFGDRENSTAVYDEFVEEYGDYELIFEEYPVLLKLLGVVTNQWRRAVGRMDDRIAADRSALVQTFNDGEELGRITDADALSDDPHGDGEVVFGIHFENDCSVVYKPRSVAGEAAVNEILDWTNARTDVPDLYTPTVLDEGEYGWMEFLPHRECDSAVAVERYYERMGGLSALAFVLGSTDLHHDNVVAMGDHPVVVDQETALSARVDSSNTPLSPATSVLLEGSILNTMLVPFTTSEAADEALSASGLSEVRDEMTEQKRPNFSHPNTDAMDLSFDRRHRFEGTNLPRFEGDVRNPSEYLTELKRGFGKVTDAILAHRDELLDSQGPLDAFENCEVRYLLRPTSHYVSKLTESVYSSQLRSGLQQSLTLESLYSIFVPSTDDDAELWRLVPAERAALQRFTIPRFTVDATGRELRDGYGNGLESFVDESPLAHARRRISNLDDHRVETQLRLLELAFSESQVAEPVSAPSDDRPDTVSDADSPRNVVSNVVGLLEETTVGYPDGSLRWAELAGTTETDCFVLREPKLDLYEGYAGVGLFVAAVAAVRDDDELAERSRRLLGPIQSAFEDGETDCSIGGMTGKGSVAYGLLTAGDLLDDAELVERARTVARRTTREEIQADTKLDVMAGSAGELLAQLAVHERTGDEAALDRARWCGERLIDATTETESGYRIPTSEDANRRFAFAHGVGGIGYALVKLSSVTDDETYARVGWDALQFDTELWRRENDADGGTTDGENDPSTVWGWCNGVAGVGTGRVAVADSVTEETVEDYSLLRENLQTELSLEDSLCCGSTGRALFMLDAGGVFDDPSLVSRGEKLFADVLERTDREGRTCLGHHLPMLPRFGLFTGLTGVGYVALQFEAREAGYDLPNVTRLE